MNYDIVIIGAGWAGFNAALNARNLGLKVLLVEKSLLGGTCLNQGCIPTKTLIQSAKTFSLFKKAGTFGIETADFKLNFIKAQKRKNDVIRQLRQGMEYMLKGIDYSEAEARFLDSNTLEIGEKYLKPRYIILATGSKPSPLKSFEFDNKKILSSDQILNLERVPDSLLIIGGGVIGCEFASLFSVFGSNVSLVEKMPQILPGEDSDVSKKLLSIFKKKGVKVYTATDAKDLPLEGFDLILIAIGRSPNTDGLNLENSGINLDKGMVVVDDYLKSNRDNIYAAGDCTGKIMLAHFAAYQGLVSSKNIASADNRSRANNNNVPNCIFTDPEISSIGLTQDKALEKGIEHKVYKYDFLASGMARLLDETEGFLKIICDKKTETILGGTIIGAHATELISNLVIAIQAKMNITELRNTILAHPTLSESLIEALKIKNGI